MFVFYLIHTWLDKAFKSTVVYQALSSLMEGHLKCDFAYSQINFQVTVDLNYNRSC